MKKRVKLKFTKRHKALITTSVISLIIFGIILLDILTTKYITKLDYFIYYHTPLIQEDLLNQFFLFITSIGNTIPLITLSVLLGIFLIFKKKYGHLIVLVSSMFIGLGLESLIKILVHRFRPELSLIKETSFSFPSAHATLAIIFFSVLLYSLLEEIKKPKNKAALGIGIGLIVLLIGFSRIYLGVHWLSDVLGGFSLGLFTISLILLILEIIFNKK